MTWEGPSALGHVAQTGSYVSGTHPEPSRCAAQQGRRGQGARAGPLADGPQTRKVDDDGALRARGEM